MTELYIIKMHYIFISTILPNNLHIAFSQFFANSHAHNF